MNLTISDKIIKCIKQHTHTTIHNNTRHIITILCADRSSPRISAMLRNARGSFYGKTAASENIRKNCAEQCSKSPGLGNFPSQDFDIFLRSHAQKFCGEFWRFAETVIFPCKMTNKYRGDLRRRRIRAKSTQKIHKSGLVKFPSKSFYCGD